MTPEQASSAVRCAECLLGRQRRSSFDYAEARRLVRQAQDRGELPMTPARYREIADEAKARGLLSSEPNQS